jgi:hypothetical protein
MGCNASQRPTRSETTTLAALGSIDRLSALP